MAFEKEGLEAVVTTEFMVGKETEEIATAVPEDQDLRPEYPGMKHQSGGRKGGAGKLGRNSLSAGAKDYTILTKRSKNLFGVCVTAETSTFPIFVNSRERPF
jgi:hypothetical protein